MDSNDRRWVWLIAIFLSALGYFAARGPVRAVDRTVDLPTFYAATRAWAAGLNPYDQPTIQHVYEQAGGPEWTVAFCVNPPAVFPLLAPLAALRYPAAVWAMLGVNLISLLVAGWAFGRAAGVFDEPKMKWLWWAAVLALAPVHTTISQGQHGLMVVALLGLALLAETSGRDVVVGLCLAVAAVLKPQMVLLFGFYYLLRGRWRVCAAGVAGVSALLAVGLGRMAAEGIDWWPDILANYALFTGGAQRTDAMAGAANYAVLGPGRFIMIDVATLTYGLTSNRVLVAASRLLMAGAAVGAAMWVARRSRNGPLSPLATYALLAVGCVLAFYNRFYAATALIAVVALGMSLIRQGSRRTGWTLLVLSAPFLAPGAAVLLQLGRGPLADSAITQSWLWRWVLLPHQVYLLLAIFVVTIAAAWRINTTPHESSRVTSDETAGETPGPESSESPA